MNVRKDGNIVREIMIFLVSGKYIEVFNFLIPGRVLKLGRKKYH